MIIPKLKQIAETLSEIDENVLPDYYNEPDFLKRLAEKEEFNKRNYDGIYINKKLD